MVVFIFPPRSTHKRFSQQCWFLTRVSHACRPLLINFLVSKFHFSVILFVSIPRVFVFSIFRATAAITPPCQANIDNLPEKKMRLIPNGNPHNLKIDSRSNQRSGYVRHGSRRPCSRKQRQRENSCPWMSGWASRCSFTGP